MENQNQDRNNQTTAEQEKATASGKQAGATATNSPTGNETAGTQKGQTAATTTTGADDMLTLMEQKKNTCMLGQWMKCLRKPALSLQYTIQKRHVSDMDNDPQGQAENPCANSDTVSVKGGFTIRYFDFAAGALTLLVTGCVMKALCCMRKIL